MIAGRCHALRGAMNWAPTRLEIFSRRFGRNLAWRSRFLMPYTPASKTKGRRNTSSMPQKTIALTGLLLRMHVGLAAMVWQAFPYPYRNIVPCLKPGLMKLSMATYRISAYPGHGLG